MKNGNIVSGCLQDCAQNTDQRNTEVSDRRFRCPECSYENDRDVYAAKNILKVWFK
ncbi:MAG: hypothetical protein DRJ31_08860 [Candidatus Methanomethylicota archaeon]|uniref:Cas12f1-like TNB domain-containing protein n=1 Tax=Thermoproteota archaeon TaxID=2056631 RepID=A0A497EKF7_9CREN|nr:MAG: hypothetical protein DRJ31_08860 [Candidatus Verstraetearchaeota archaeon]